MRDRWLIFLLLIVVIIHSVYIWVEKVKMSKSKNELNKNV